MAINLSGYVHNLQDAPLVGVALILTGTSNQTTSTNSSGYYEFLGIPEGNYELSPSLSPWIFNPPEREYTNLTTSLVNQNFKAGQEPLFQPIKLSLLYDDYKTEQMYSVDIATADGTTGQDVMKGTGIKTTHIQTGAITETYYSSIGGEIWSTSTTWANITALSFTLTGTAKVCITAACTARLTSAANTAGEYRIECGGVTRHSTIVGIIPINQHQTSVSLHWVGDLSAGSYVARFQLRRHTGTGTVYAYGSEGNSNLSVVVWKR